MSNATEFANNDVQVPYVNGTTTTVESQDEPEQWKRPLAQRDMILEHLRSGKTLTQQEAEDLYGCNAVSAVIYWLKKEGLNVVTDRIRNERGRSIARYRLVEGPEEPQPADAPAQVPQEEPEQTPEEEPTEPTALPEPVQPQQAIEPIAQDAAESVQSLAVVMDLDGPRLQIDDASYRLSKAQMRYLAVTMALFAEMDE